MRSKPILSLHFLAALAASLSLAACSNLPAGEDHDQHHEGQTDNATAASGTSATQGATMAGNQGGCAMMNGSSAENPAGCAMIGSSQAGSQGSGAGMQQRNKEEMCAMYRTMRDAPNERARQAMMDRHMQSMSPTMRQRHMDMMGQQCQ